MKNFCLFGLQIAPGKKHGKTCFVKIIFTFWKFFPIFLQHFREKVCPLTFHENVSKQENVPTKRNGNEK